MKKALLLAIVIVSINVGTVFATPQIPDLLIYESTEYPITQTILEPYFEKFPGRNPKDDDFACSGLWRGYRAVFEVVKSEIFLKDVLVNVCFGPVRSALSQTVPDGKPLKIDWVTDVLVSMYGENAEDPYGLESWDSFEKYSLFEVVSGTVKAVKHFDNVGYHQFRRMQFDEFRKTPEYGEKLRKMTADGKTTKKDADREMLFWYFFSANKFY